MISESTQSIEIFFCYAHDDKSFRDELDQHLAALKYSGLICSWHDGEIVPGDPWEEVIKKHLNRAQIVLLLISVSFLNSDYSYRIEMSRALERHNAGTARVIPILLRPVYLKGTPLSELQMLPTGAKPITRWSNRDAAFTDVAEGIERAVNEIQCRLVRAANPGMQGEKRDQTPSATIGALPVEAVKPQQAGQGKFIIQNNASVQGQTIGNHNIITQQFGDEPKV